MTGRPAALRALALASTARVADSVMEEIRAEIREVMCTLFQAGSGALIGHPRGCRGQPGLVLEFLRDSPSAHYSEVPRRRSDMPDWTALPEGP